MSMRWDWAAIRIGAAVAIVLALPLAIGARVAADRDNESLAIGLSFGATLTFVLFAGLVGGFVGQRLRSAGVAPARLDRRER